MLRHPATLPRAVPWTNWDEWRSVKQGLFAAQPEARRRALRMVQAWRVSP
jgi:hypothetical protein